MKIYVLIVIAILVLSGCVTKTATPQQHQQLVEKFAILDTCNRQGLLHPDLAAQALNFHRSELGQHKYQQKLLDEYNNAYAQRYRNGIHPTDCRVYATSVHSDILAQQEAQQAYARSLAQFNQNMQNLSNSFANSAYQQMQLNQQMNQNLINMPQYQPQPIRQSQTATNCMRVANGMYNCQSRTR